MSGADLIRITSVMQLHPPSTTIPDSPADAASAADSRAGRRPLSQRQRRWTWAGTVLALVLLLIFVPPLVNANRFQRQIARSMSESLGRPVHLDSVALHLLPLPGITITNFVVSEDPEFGDEPTIRANTVEATLRLGSLWRRRVEFSRVRFVEPSVNLVRNAEGRWNLSAVLVNASKLDTAPTVQRRSGPAPRFPYIEATGGRVNIKFGENKLPFSLTDADFALWLPSSKQWSVRLKGSPARTDTSIGEPGVLRIEGTLERAATSSQVPVDLRVSWHDVPLGEASRFLTAEDQGWRGTLDLDLAMEGRLGEAQMRSRLTLDGLRRAEFAPANPLDLQITCGAGMAIEMVTLRDLQCAMPDSAPDPMVLRAASLDLAHPGMAQASVSAHDIPLRWGLLWAALFSARVPTDLHPEGTLAVHMEHVPLPQASAQPALPTPAAHKRSRRGRPAAGVQQAAGWGQWSGTVQVKLPPVPAGTPPGSATATRTSGAETTLVWKGQPAAAATGVDTQADAGSGLAFVLSPVSIPVGQGESLIVSAELTPAGYAVAVVGTADADTLLLPARYLPQLGDGMDQVLPYPPTGAQPVRVDFTCTHPWGGAQTCVSLRPSITKPGTAKGTPVSVGATIVPGPAQPVAPSLLAPRSLSPLDQNPRLGGPPPDDLPSEPNVPASQPPGSLPHL